MKETMTIHKALSELKILSSRISNEIGNIDFVVANKHSNQKISGESIQKYIDNTIDKYKSVCTLINRRNAIKQAVTRSNAVTKVVINGKEYTVAEAIDMKSVGMSFIENILSRMRSQYDVARRNADRENNDRLETRADEYMKTLYQGSDLKNMSEEMRKSRENFIVSQTYELVDPVNVNVQITRLQNELDAFMSEVDSALSVSNALTTIEVEYETV